MVPMWRSPAPRWCALDALPQVAMSLVVSQLTMLGSSVEAMEKEQGEDQDLIVFFISCSKVLSARI
jgi:hypothetical protein